MCENQAELATNVPDSTSIARGFPTDAGKAWYGWRQGGL